MGKVMRVYLCGQDWTNSHEEMYLDLPATPWKLVDAMEKLNLTKEADLYVQAEEYYDFDYIQGFIPESTSLSQLNELCAVLNSMDDMDRIGFRGLLQSSAFFDRFSLGIDKLMDIAQAKGCYHIAEDISNDTQLGRFLCFNGFVDGVGELPEKVYELLNFEKIGKDYRMAEHGAFADGCYVAPDGEIPHREMHYEICPPEYVVMLDVVNKADMNSHWPLALPAVPEEMVITLRHIGAESWDEAVCVCTDCQIPQLMETVTQTGNIATINRFASILEGVSAEDITKLKAVLEVMHCDDLITASLIAGELDNFMLSDNIRNPEDYAQSGSSNGYAIEGVIYTYLKVADFKSVTVTDNNIERSELMYGIGSNAANTAFLNAIGVSANDRYTAADETNGDVTTYYYRSDTLITGLQNALTSNATTVKNALESYVTSNGGTAMSATDANGHSAASDLPLGLYLFVETSVPEQVTSTTAPFLISIPMTSTTASGSSWIYDVTVYPKNLTGLPTLDKTVREAKISSGKNNGSAAITDGYAESATASEGDTVEYQILSTLPSITSTASQLSTYTFVDTLSKGISYKKNDVVLEFYKEASCTNKIATWTADSEKFTVAYSAGANGEGVMTIAMTAAGLNEINTSNAVYTEAGMVNSGYSDCTLRITYAGLVGSNADVILGDSGNPNDVTLTWKRSNTAYYDTLTDEAIVYTYGLDVTKNFSDGRGDATKVEFLIQNSTDNYYLTGSLNTTENVWYVIGKTTDTAAATHFIPTAAGKLTIKGVEDDTYTLTEVKTDAAYTLLKAPVQVLISKSGTATTAKVDNNAVTMAKSGNSNNALVPFTVINTRGFDLPQTGGTGNWLFPVVGMVMLAACIVGIVILMKKKPAQE